MDTVYFTKSFWVAAGDRGFRSLAQGVLFSLGTDTTITAFDVPWLDHLGVGLTFSAISLLTSVAAPPREVRWDHAASGHPQRSEGQDGVGGH